MTKDQLIELTQNYITASGSIPTSIGIPEFERIISDSARWFFHNYRYAAQQKYYHIEKSEFDKPEFKSTRQIQFPDCVISVVWVKEANNANFIGILDRDITEQRMVAAEIYFAPYGSDDLVYRTANYAYYDLTKAFFLDYMQFDYNINSHRLSILGRNPRYNVVTLTWVKVAEESLYEDPYFIDYVRGQALISMGRTYSFFNFNLPSNITVNASELISSGQQIVEEVKQKIKEEDAPDFFMMVH